MRCGVHHSCFIFCFVLSCSLIRRTRGTSHRRRPRTRSKVPLDPIHIADPTPRAAGIAYDTPLLSLAGTLHLAGPHSSMSQTGHTPPWWRFPLRPHRPQPSRPNGWPTPPMPSYRDAHRHGPRATHAHTPMHPPGPPTPNLAGLRHLCRRTAYMSL